MISKQSKKTDDRKNLPPPETLPPIEREKFDEIEIVTSPIGGTIAGGQVVATCTRISTQTTLDRLLRYRLLHDDIKIARTLYDAGNRLHNDWYVAGLQPATIVNLLGLRGGKGEFTDKQIAARKRFNNAMLGLSLTLRDVAYDLCCLDYSIRRIEHDHHWHRKTGLVLIRATLIDLSRGYGLLPSNFSLR